MTNRYANDPKEIVRLDAYHGEKFVQFFFAMSKAGREKAIADFNRIVGECVSLRYRIVAPKEGSKQEEKE